MNKLCISEANKEYFELNEPQYYANMRKWYVSIKYDPNFFLHDDGTIQCGTAVEYVPGEKLWSGFYDTPQAAKKAIKLYNQKWLLEQQGSNLESELAKEFEGLL